MYVMYAVKLLGMGPIPNKLYVVVVVLVTMAITCPPDTYGGPAPDPPPGVVENGQTCVHALLYSNVLGDQEKDKVMVVPAAACPHINDPTKV